MVKYREVLKKHRCHRPTELWERRKVGALVPALRGFFVRVDLYSPWDMLARRPSTPCSANILAVPRSRLATSILIWMAASTLRRKSAFRTGHPLRTPAAIFAQIGSFWNFVLTGLCANPLDNPFTALYVPIP